MLLLWQEFSLQPCKDNSIPIFLLSLSSSLTILATARIHTNINVLEDSANTVGPLRNIAQAVPGPATPVLWDRSYLTNYLPYPQYPTSFTVHSHHCSTTYKTKPLSKIFHHWWEEHMHTAYTDSASKEPSLAHYKSPTIHSYTKNHPQLRHQLSSKVSYS